MASGSRCEERLAQERARRGIKQEEPPQADPAEGETEEDSPLQETYLKENFRDYVQDKYLVDDRKLLQNDTVMQMIYALEWYDVPRNCKADLIEFHPYLTEADHERLYYIKTQHMCEQAGSFLVAAMMVNRVLYRVGGNLFRRLYARIPVNAAAGFAALNFMNKSILYKLLDDDFKEEKLDKYFELDLNADMMREDLAKMGIRIKAAHFDLAEVQKRIDAKTAGEEAAKKV